MSEDRFTEITGESWFGRIGGAIKGILLGVILFFVSFPVLFWNEGRSVQTYKTLKEGEKTAVSIAAGRVDASNTGKLVYLTGKAQTDATLADSVFGVTAPKVLKLRRNVEMYQWTEKKSSTTRKKFGGGTETVTNYDYSRAWSAKPIDSSSFKKTEGHQNPGTFPYDSREWTATPIMLGAFQLSGSLVGKIDNYTPFEVKPPSPLPAGLQGKAKAVDAGYYLGEEPGTPRIGDLRVAFKTANPTDVSVIARQLNDTFEPYRAKAGGAIELLQIGVVSLESMIQTAQRENQILTWVLRGLGFFLMFFGLSLIMRPLSVLADLIPLIGDIIGAGTGLIAFLLAGVLSLLTVAIAWFVYRPLLGIGLIAAAVGLTAVIRNKIQQKKSMKTPAGLRPV